MKALVLAAFAALSMEATLVSPAPAQTAALQSKATRILAIGTIAPNVDLASVRAILPIEVRETVKLYLAGKIDQWFSLTDRTGVVFLLNTTDLKGAGEMLEALPLGKAHMMHFELMPLAPLAPLQSLIGAAAGHVP